jgi:hypothetical protein
LRLRTNQVVTSKPELAGFTGVESGMAHTFARNPRL